MQGKAGGLVTEQGRWPSWRWGGDALSCHGAVGKERPGGVELRVGRGREGGKHPW